MKLYRGARDAVELHEEAPLAGVWTLFHVAGSSPAFVYGELVASFDAILRKDADPLMKEVRRQMDHPDFMEYIADKLSAGARRGSGPDPGRGPGCTP